MTTGVETDRNRALLAWYRERRRSLPWRDRVDPYAILVSEVMLQQTQVARVVPAYERFLDRFPTVGVLAEAPLVAVLAAWSGLGYNSRARRLREAARVVVVEGWPTTPEGLRRLPGVGPYTAAAVASLAFGVRVPAIDTNVRRVLSRWHGEPLDGPGLRAAAEAALDDDAGTWNQAMMDLGATVCRARRPDCGPCPVTPWCAGPDGYRPPRPQPRFEGSARQLRGALVRSLVRCPASFRDLTRETGFPTVEVELALEDLVAEGLVVRDPDGTYRLGD